MVDNDAGICLSQHAAFY